MDDFEDRRVQWLRRDRAVARVKRSKGWPDELHQAADQYEAAMDQMFNGTITKENREDVMLQLKNVHRARDYFVMLRKQWEGGWR